MSWQEEQAGPAGPRLDEELRSALGGTGELFDYDALVAGTKVRATRMRRRRAVVQGAAAAVLVPALVGAGFAIHDSLGQRVGVVAGPAVSGTDGTAATSQAPSATAPIVADRPPFQDPAALPQAPPAETNPQWPNRWEVADVRPTGIAFLDAFGSPQTSSQYPREVPLAGLQGGGDGAEPHSAAAWSFFDGSNDLEQPTVDLAVTAWDDSRAVLAGLRSDQPISSARWVAPPDLRPWPGQDDEDHLLVSLGSSGPWPQVGALVRQGDYLVGVTTQAATEEEAAEAAMSIAEQSAANLAWLDPEHGQDGADRKAGTDEQAQTTQPAPAAGVPPYQDPALLGDLGVPLEAGGNRIEVPDVRPTGVAALGGLDGLSPVETVTPHLTPALNVTVTQELAGASPHSGRQWIYRPPATGAELVLTLTAWDDSQLAFDDLVGGGTATSSRWLGPDGRPAVPEKGLWPGHEDDPDSFLTRQAQWGEDPPAPLVAVALIRQGDYLVAVTVQGTAELDLTGAAAEVAERAAANLAALDPEHGRD